MSVAVIKTTKLGKNKATFMFSGQTLYNAVKSSKYVSFQDVEKCGICGGTDLVLDCHEAGGYEYTTINCKGCRAQLTVGERKDKSAVFLRKDESGNFVWRAYTPPQQQGQQNPVKQQFPNSQVVSQPVDNGELPF